MHTKITRHILTMVLQSDLLLEVDNTMHNISRFLHSKQTLNISDYS